MAKLDVDTISMLLLEDQYPYFTDDQLESLVNTYTNLNQLMYIACNMKAQAEKITIGPISIESSGDMWTNMANMYLALWEQDLEAEKGTSSSLTGKVMRRADEY